jgi:Icc-related predicted phosphoesterase
MKIVAISDTHGSHTECPLIECDVLVHAGDITNRGEMECLKDFAHWLADYPAEHKIVIAGNHDWCFYKRNKGRNVLEDNGIIYLQDEGCKIGDINFWGSPWQPDFCNWAFNRPRGIALREKWQLVPEETDVLITHGPPATILDAVGNSGPLGCVDLLEEVIDRIKPRAHIFGHVHAGYGERWGEGIRFVNASLLDESYCMTNAPREMEI